MFLGIDHVQLLGPEGCEQEARNFYENLLGMKTVLKPENLRHRGGIWFQCGTQEVHISIQDDYIPAKKHIQLLSWKILRRLDVSWHTRAAFFLKKSLLQGESVFLSMTRSEID